MCGNSIVLQITTRAITVVYHQKGVRNTINTRFRMAEDDKLDGFQDRGSQKRTGGTLDRGFAAMVIKKILNTTK